MARIPGPLRRFSWMMVLNMAMVARRHWQDVPPADRKRLAELVRRSRGLPQNLSAAERRELLEIVRRVDFMRLGRDVMPFAFGGRRRRW